MKPNKSWALTSCYCLASTSSSCFGNRSNYITCLNSWINTQLPLIYSFSVLQKLYNWSSFWKFLGQDCQSVCSLLQNTSTWILFLKDVHKLWSGQDSSSCYKSYKGSNIPSTFPTAARLVYQLAEPTQASESEHRNIRTWDSQKSKNS